MILLNGGTVPDAISAANECAKLCTAERSARSRDRIKTQSLKGALISCSRRVFVSQAEALRTVNMVVILE